MVGRFVLNINMQQKFIWGGLFIGSSLGGYIPSLWGAGIFSVQGVFLSAVGGILGIWLGYRIGKNF